MKVLEIIVIPRQKHVILQNRVEEMAWVGCAGQGCIGGRDDMVTSSPEPRNQGAFGAVVIQIQIHALAESVGAYGHLSRPAALISASSRARSASSKSLFLMQ
jgi:hypothetical protein